MQADGPGGARNGIAAAREMLLANDTSAATVALRKQMISLASALNESASQPATKTPGAMMVQHQNPDLVRAKPGRLSLQSIASSNAG